MRPGRRLMERAILNHFSTTVIIVLFVGGMVLLTLVGVLVTRRFLHEWTTMRDGNESPVATAALEAVYVEYRNLKPSDNVQQETFGLALPKLDDIASDAEIGRSARRAGAGESASRLGTAGRATGGTARTATTTVSSPGNWTPTACSAAGGRRGRSGLRTIRWQRATAPRSTPTCATPAPSPGGESGEPADAHRRLLDLRSRRARSPPSRTPG